jgi:hypothetical protein
MANNSSEVRQGLVTLIARVTELAQSINTDHDAFVHHQGLTGTISAKLNAVAETVQNMEQYLNKNSNKVAERFNRIETACTNTAQAVTAQFMAKCKEYFELLSKFKKEQDSLRVRLKDLETHTRTGPAALSLATALQKRLKTMAAQIFALQA